MEFLNKLADTVVNSTVIAMVTCFWTIMLIDFGQSAYKTVKNFLNWLRNKVNKENQ